MSLLTHSSKKSREMQKQNEGDYPSSNSVQCVKANPSQISWIFTQTADREIHRQL